MNTIGEPLKVPVAIFDDLFLVLNNPLLNVIIFLDLPEIAFKVCNFRVEHFFLGIELVFEPFDLVLMLPLELLKLYFVVV